MPLCPSISIFQTEYGSDHFRKKDFDPDPQRCSGYNPFAESDGMLLVCRYWAKTFSENFSKTTPSQNMTGTVTVMVFVPQNLPQICSASALSIPQTYTDADAVQIFGKFWDPQV